MTPDATTYRSVLAIETATPVCSVALLKPDGRIIEKRTEGTGVHSEKTFIFISELLEASGLSAGELDAVIFSNGPGSYTGLRIGAAAVKGLLFGTNIPLFLFPSLLSYAAGLEPEKNHASQTIHAVIDARRNHLYVQQVSGDLEEVGKPGVTELGEIKKGLKEGDVVIGTGWERLNIEPDGKIRTVGTEGISAKSLLTAFGNKRLKSYFGKADPRSFEPDYLTLSQVNNSQIRG